jgi:opacity protein-like surface antigen
MGAGLNYVPEMTFESDTYPLSVYPRMLDYELGFAGYKALGGHLMPNFRTEGELSYRYNALDGVTVHLEGPQDFTGGSVSAFGIMANGWMDFPTGTNWTPYVGGGVGGANVHVSLDTDVSAPCFCYGVDIDSSQWVFAYQVGAGVAIDMGVGITATIDYRYFATADFTVPFTTDGSPPSGETTTNYSAHSAMLGLRFPLGAP